VATAKALLNTAMKEPMSAAGWTPKAAGWFVRPVTSDVVAVASTSVATAHAHPGEGQATVHVGLRVEPVEQAVSSLLGDNDGGYKSRTVTTPLGYVTPEKRWREWQVSVRETDAVATEMASLLATDGWAYISALAADSGALLAATRDSPAMSQSVGLARLVVLLHRFGRSDEARRTVWERQEQLTSRSDAAANDQRETATSLLAWLDGNRV
jgi:hypothetical protein